MNLKEIILSIAIGFLTYFANYFSLLALFTIFPITIAWTMGNGGGGWWLDKSIMVKVFYVGLIAPLIEELVFRRGVLEFFISKELLIPGLILSSILFGAWHMVIGWGFLKALDMIFIGLVFGAVYLKFGLKGSLICHLANNLLYVLMMLN